MLPRINYFKAGFSLKSGELKGPQTNDRTATPFLFLSNRIFSFLDQFYVPELTQCCFGCLAKDLPFTLGIPDFEEIQIPKTTSSS